MSDPEHTAWIELADASSRVWVDALEIREALDEPYEVVCRLGARAAEELAVSIGDAVTIQLERQGASRRFHGIVRELARSIVQSEAWTLEIVVAPAFGLLDRGMDSRVFQDLTVVEILREVLEAALGDYGRTVDLGALSGTYPKRELCLQYRESIFAFASRLMEDEGISYHFVHDGDAESLVLTDSNAAFQEVLCAEGGPIAFRPVVGGEDELGEAVEALLKKRSLTTTAVTVRNRDWTRPSVEVQATSPGVDERGREREIYLHDAECTLSEMATGSGFGSHDAAPRAERAGERARLPAESCEGQGRVVGFRPGATFELRGHPLPELDGEYLLRRVEHRFEPESRRYVNVFVCAPTAAAHRPERRTPRPRIPTIQTAIVTGPAGEEIHTDELGRVKVRFHWDRLGPDDDGSSCWLRVRQPWAGEGWGFLFVPRVGMEVMVGFAGGHPDRPRVLGCVYNGDNRPPYPLPDEKTKSTIKSRSSLGGGGFNELRFEDAAGDEEVFLHAQKDLDEVIENDHNTDVGANQTNDVGANQTEEIGSNQTMDVGANRTVHVGAAFDETIDGGETRTVTGGVTETIDGGETRSVSGGLTETISGGETRVVNGALTETITATHAWEVGGSSTQTIGAALTQTIAGGASISTPASYDITALGGFNVIAPAGVTVEAAAGHLAIAAGGNTLIDSYYDQIGGFLNDLFSVKIWIAGLKVETSVVRIRGGAFKYELWDTVGERCGAKFEIKGQELSVSASFITNAAFAVMVGFTDLDP